jgi:hypothetical protein
MWRCPISVRLDHFALIAVLVPRLCLGTHCLRGSASSVLLQPTLRMTETAGGAWAVRQIAVLKIFERSILWCFCSRCCLQISDWIEARRAGITSAGVEGPGGHLIEGQRPERPTQPFPFELTHGGSWVCQPFGLSFLTARNRWLHHRHRICQPFRLKTLRTEQNSH